jgi:hypothetical protein
MERPQQRVCTNTNWEKYRMDIQVPSFCQRDSQQDAEKNAEALTKWLSNAISRTHWWNPVLETLQKEAKTINWRISPKTS